MDMLSNVMWLHPKISEVERFCLQFLPIHGPKKMRSPNYTAKSPLTRELSGLGLIELQNGNVFTRADRGHTFFHEHPSGSSSSCTAP